MKKKIIFLLVLIVFVIIMICSNYLLKKATNKKIDNENQIINQANENNNEKEENKMEILKVTEGNFEEEVLKSNKTVLIDFYADWCGPCKMLSPIVEQVAGENPDVKVVKINVDEQQELAINYDVMSIPTLVVIKNGQEVNRSIGLIGKSEIINLIK